MKKGPTRSGDEGRGSDTDWDDEDDALDDAFYARFQLDDEREVDSAERGNVAADTSGLGSSPRDEPESMVPEVDGASELDGEDFDFPLIDPRSVLSSMTGLRAEEDPRLSDEPAAVEAVSREAREGDEARTSEANQPSSEVNDSRPPLASAAPNPGRVPDTPAQRAASSSASHAESRPRVPRVAIAALGILVPASALLGWIALRSDEPSPSETAVEASQDEAPLEDTPEALHTDGASEADVPEGFEHDESIERSERVMRLIGAGNFRRRQGRQTIAVRRYEAALRLDPRNGRALAGLSRSYLGLGQTGSAVRTARRLVQIYPSRANNHILLGDVLEAHGDPDGARDAWRRALDIHPSNKAARRRLRR